MGHRRPDSFVRAIVLVHGAVLFIERPWNEAAASPTMFAESIKDSGVKNVVL